MATDADLAFALEVVDSARLKAHEEILEDHVRLVVAGLRKLGELRDPVVADRASGVILDGHHRHEALRRMGYRKVPVAFVDYRDPRIRVEAWREGERAATKDEVVAMTEKGRLYPPKTTRHRFPHGLPQWPVKLDALR